jgi:hypothetical protein
VSKRKSLKEALAMKQSVRCILTLVLCCVLSLSGVLVGVPAARAADTGTWTQLSAFAWSIRSLAINPLTPTTLYADTFCGGGVFHSADSGVAQREGFALFEDTAIDKGQVRTRNFSTRIIPTVRDVPEHEYIIVENLEGTRVLGLCGIGEVTMGPIIPAIGLAIHDATGVWLRHLPATAERAWRSHWRGRLMPPGTECYVLSAQVLCE